MVTQSLFFIFFFVILNAANAQNVAEFKRFEYKHSFRAPNLSQRDGSISFWSVNGDAIASSEQLRLAPSIRSRKGIAWNKRPFVESYDFEVEVAFKVTGQGKIGADGLAIWYTSKEGAPGPVFGANDYWSGLAVILDSFDNDGAKNNPAVSIMMNDGTRSFDHHSDGASQVLSTCQKDFRNKPYPVRMRLQYLNKVVTIMISDGLTADPRYELCLRVENIVLPSGGYFGVSAATGGLADDHDILDFSVFSLHQKVQQTAQQIPQDERQKYDAEFVKQMQEYEEERKKFKEEHPDKVREDEDPSKYYEDATSRELRFIHESQSAIYRVLQQLETKLTEISQTQGVHTAYFQRSGGNVAQQPATGGAVAPQIIDGFQPHEKTEVLQSLRDLATSHRDLKNYVNEIFTRTYKMEQAFGTGTGGNGIMQESQHVRATLETIQNELRQFRAQQQGSSSDNGSCANLSCVSTSFLTVVIALQSVIILAFVYLRSKHEKAKFY